MKKVADNEKALKDLGLYDEYSQMARERQFVEKQISDISKAKSGATKAYDLAAGQERLEKGAISKATEVAKRAGEEAAITKEKAAPLRQTVEEKTAEVAKLGKAQRKLNKLYTDLNDPELSPKELGNLTKQTFEQLRNEFPELITDEMYEETSYRLSKAVGDLERTENRLKFAQDVRYFIGTRLLGNLAISGIGGYGAYKLFGGTGNTGHGE